MRTMPKRLFLSTFFLFSLSLSLLLSLFLSPCIAVFRLVVIVMFVFTAKFYVAFDDFSFITNRHNNRTVNLPKICHIYSGNGSIWPAHTFEAATNGKFIHAVERNNMMVIFVHYSFVLFFHVKKVIKEAK